MSLPKELFCVKCKSTNGDLLSCSRCKVVKYCDRKCQGADFKVHKKLCSIIAKKEGNLRHKALYCEARRTESLLAYQAVQEIFDDIFENNNDSEKIPFETFTQAFMTYMNLGLLEKAQKVHEKFTIYENRTLELAGSSKAAQLHFEQNENRVTPVDRLIRKFALLNLQWDQIIAQKPKTIKNFVEAMETFEEKSVHYEVGQNWIVQQKIHEFLYLDECLKMEKECTEVYKQIDEMHGHIMQKSKEDFKGFFLRILDRKDRPIMKEFMDLYRFCGQIPMQIDLAHALRTGENPSFEFQLGF